MPIKWSAETDQTLLLKILETSNVNADTTAIAAAWPKNLEAPTPRAISERLVKIRAMAKSSGSAAHFSVSVKRPNSKPSTPRKPIARRPAGAKQGANGVRKAAGGAKRKRGRKIESSSDTEADSPVPSFKETSSAGTVDADADTDEATQATVKMEMAPEDEGMSPTGNVKGEPSDEDEMGDMQFAEEI